jgi:hypothetical protein
MVMAIFKKWKLIPFPESLAVLPRLDFLPGGWRSAEPKGLGKQARR